MSMLLKRRRPASAEINVTSLVDVMMTVLIIFILIAPIIEQGIDIELPSAKATRIDQPSEPVTVSIQEVVEGGEKKGVIFVNEKRMRGNPYEQLELTLLEMKQNKPELSVIIRADKKFRYEAVIKVLDVVRNSGITTLSLATEGQ